MTNIQLIDPQRIKPNPYQPRAAMDPGKLDELAASILKHGLLQPPRVRAVNGGYELAFGHRRFAAWVQAKPGEFFPAMVQAITDREMFEVALSENDDREALNPVERARALQRYIAEFGVSQAEAAPGCCWQSLEGDVCPQT